MVAEQVHPALAASPACRVRWVDAEAFTARCSGVLIVETSDVRAWNHLWERVRDTDLFAVPYLRLEAIIPSIEDGYAEFEAAEMVAAIRLAEGTREVVAALGLSDDDLAAATRVLEALARALAR